MPALPPLPPSAVDARRRARSMFWLGWGITEIADELAASGVRNDKGAPIPRATIEAWKQRDKWDDYPAIRRMEDCLEVRWQALILKPNKSGADFKEIDLLGRQVAQLAKVRRYEEPGGHEGDLNSNVLARNAGPKKKAKKNHFTAEQAAELRAIFEKQLYGYQETWRDSTSLRTRMILKSRQIGATYYFAFEALVDAVETGRNQIFLSASKAQAYQFKNYIIGFANLVGVSLSGDPMVITSDVRPDGEPGAELHFLGTNFRTAQGRSGNFYFDEFFWVHNFAELNKVASGMATHKRWRKTYFSTPSTVGHPAYEYWTGERRNRRKRKEERIEIDVSHDALKDGAMGPDNVWRQIVTIDDAVASGFDLVDLEELHDEYADDEFANLFGCVFVDDSLSAFKFNDLTACGVDTMVEWDDFDPDADRPVGDRAVWAGYDPQGGSEDGDNAALVIGIPPSGPGGTFRLLEKHQLRGLDFEDQALFIVRMLERYNCTYLGIDANGVGIGVWQMLEKSVLRSVITKIEYSLDAKQRMIMKAQNVFRRGRIRFDSGWVDLMSSFISIKKTLTSSGRSVTFQSGRAVGEGHGDLAWATMHILNNEPLDGKEPEKATMEIL